MPSKLIEIIWFTLNSFKITFVNGLYQFLDALRVVVFIVFICVQ